MDELIDQLRDWPVGDIGASLLIVASVLLIRWLIVRAITRDTETQTAEQRKWISFTRNAAIILILVGLLVVWSLELSRFALSVAAFAVAIVIASKELILCLSGGLYRTVTRPYEIGDWIEVGPYRGEILEEGLLSTVLQELSADGQTSQEYTGRRLVIPNAVLLSHPVINMNLSRRFVFHTFDVTVAAADAQPSADLERLQALMDAEWHTYADLAERYWAMARRRTGIDLRRPDPEVQLTTTDLGHARYKLRILCQRDAAADIQRRITTTFLEATRTQRASAAPEAETGATRGVSAPRP